MPAKSVDEVLAEFRSQPGINVTKLKTGTRVIVETTQMIYELEVTHPINGIVRVFSTDTRLRAGVTGEFLESCYDINGSVSLPRWIGKTLRMQFNFKNGIYSCTPALSAKVSGPGWHIEVF